MRNWLPRLFAKAKPAQLAGKTVPLETIRRAFDAAAQDEEHFPATIDPRIYHVRLLADYFSPLAGGQWLDAGCGKGRFARVLKEQFPEVRIVGFDLSLAMLRRAPAGMAACCGTMTQLPFADATFDCVYATESLEHAVDIEQAVGELCRVLRPGGRLAIIDKNIEHWGRLQTPEWERWFDRRALERLLRRWCRRVSSMPVSYWEDVEPDGLFLAWLAEK